MMRVRYLAPALFCAALLLSACDTAPAATEHSAGAAIALPADATVLQDDQILHQCSRGTPAPGQSVSAPSPQAINDLEAALPAALSARATGSNEPSFTKVPQGWRRQYVGYVRNGRRLIYGNFFPADDNVGENWRTQPVIVCDGGHAFFGVEYDVDARRFTHIDVNGFA